MRRNRRKHIVTGHHPGMLLFLLLLLFSLVVFVARLNSSSQDIRSRASTPYPCAFQCAAPVCSDGFIGESFCANITGGGCNQQQDEWCKAHGHIGQTSCYEAGTCGSGAETAGQLYQQQYAESQGKKEASPTATPTLPPAPPTFASLPENVRNYLELLYYWVTYFGRSTTFTDILRQFGIIQESPSQLPSTTPTVQQTPTAPPQNANTRYRLINGQCVPDSNGSSLEACRLLIPQSTTPTRPPATGTSAPIPPG